MRYRPASEESRGTVRISRGAGGRPDRNRAAQLGEKAGRPHRRSAGASQHLHQLNDFELPTALAWRFEFIFFKREYDDAIPGLPT